MAKSVSVKFDASSALDGLDAITEGAHDQVRPAAQAGAQVLYDEVKVRVPVSKKTRKLKSGRTVAPGALRDSIYQVYSKDNSQAERATYHVSWNYKKAPHGHLVEFGTSRSPAHPFLRPAYDAKVNEALQASREKFRIGMKAIPGVS